MGNATKAPSTQRPAEPTPAVRVALPPHLPSVGLPVALPPAPAQAKPTTRWVPRRFLALGAGLVAVAVALTGTVVLVTADDSGDRAQRALAQGGSAVTDVSRRLAGAEKLDELRAAGRDAQRRVNALAGPAAALASLDDDEVRGPAVRQLATDREILNGYALLAKLDETDLGAAQVGLRRAAAATTELPRRQQATAALELPGAPQSFATTGVTSAIDTAETTLERADERLTSWRAKRRRAVAKRNRKVAALRSYQGTMEGALGTYGGLRTELQRWIDEVDDSGTSFEDAFDYLETASAKRRQVRDQIAATTAPAVATAAHAELVRVLDTSLAAMDEAQAGLSDYEHDFADYDDYEDTPGWEQFQRASTEISGRFGPVEGHWQSLLDDAVAAAKHRSLPNPPNV